ncbi:phosphoenolpyruvate synthase [Allokutzneria multivorans]|uniref:Phosphoenolpyruvate synthase n=1 Tax=Allokutzneria multivorans TaxID=1142134 RepID=A0ABP7QZR3_9PSEU
MHVLTSDTSSGEKGRLAGAKARHLRELARGGIDVPPWSVLGLDVFAAFLRGEGLERGLSALLSETTLDNAGEQARLIAELIEGAGLPDEVTELIERAHGDVGADRVAVRSSGAEEDGAEFSFAGQFSSYLNVIGLDDVARRVRGCWASAFTERSLHYRLRNGLPLRADGVAVIIQAMVPAERSGVLFTANPVNGSRAQYVISAAYGLGEGLVSGAVDADTVVLDAASGAVVETVIGDKQERYHPAEDASGYLVSEVDAAKREALSLSGRDIARLHEAGRRIAELFGGPQDIEWAVHADRLWILQSRPITSPLQEIPSGEQRIWDNSNIIESFSGIVSPLTYSFASSVYGKVYRHYAMALGVPAAELRQMDEWLPTMLGYFHGRVYYNLLHWYRMVRLAPVYRLNRKVLEVSLGVEESLDDDLANSLHPYKPRALVRLRTTIGFTKRFLGMNRSVDGFLRYFYDAYKVFDNVDYDSLSGEEVYRRFRALERDLIEKWGPMMALDASILLSFGTLYLLTKRWLPDAPEWFNWAAASPGTGVESAEPVKALAALAATVRADAELREIVEKTDPEQTAQALADAGHTAFLAAIEDYVSRFGYRSLDELKLEVPDLHEDPATLYVMLREALPEVSTAQPEQAQSYLDKHLRGPKRWLYEIVRRKTSTCLADRERLRFARTRAFGSAKRMLRAMGRDLARTGRLDDWRDVFFLRLEELRGTFEGTIAHTELKHLVALRRKQQDEDAKLVAPSRFTTYGTPGNLEQAGWSSQHAGPSGKKEFRGTPSCPGVVEGRAVVTDVPREVDGGILLTYRTDPGWVATLPTASALVIERGSPLTHVAIVARELGIPTVVQVKDITREIQTGMRVRLDGAAGTITVLSSGGDDE